MWRSGDADGVTCIACGDSLVREKAREYDKHGDRWERREKAFEYLCKPCDRHLCHQPRDGLESRLVAAGAGETDRASFLDAYAALVEDGTGGPTRERS